MIITLKPTLLRGRFCEGDWSANIELDESIGKTSFQAAAPNFFSYLSDRYTEDGSQGIELFDMGKNPSTA